MTRSPAPGDQADRSAQERRDGTDPPAGPVPSGGGLRSGPRRFGRPRRSGVVVSGLAAPRMAVRDLGAEALAGLLARPGRALLTALGTVLGIAALVATLGVSRTAGSQIVGRFDELAATQVVVKPAGADQPGAGNSGITSVIPWDAGERLVRLNGVVSAATLSDVDLGGALVRAVPVNDPTGQRELAMTVRSASPSILDALRGRLATGRTFDAGHSARADRIVLLGRGAAERLGISRVDNAPAIYIGEHLYTVIGIVEDVRRNPAVLNGLIIPDGTARHEFGLEAPAAVYVDTRVGAATLIGNQAPLALSPNNPDLLSVSAPGEPRRVRSDVEGDVNSLFLVLGGVSLLVGAVGIANVTLVSVLERVGEIGLRRAMGAARRHIAAQFLTESMVLGLVGGVVGASLGTLIIVGISAARSWTPVLDSSLALAAPVVGGVVGLLAGVYPSLRAASLEPVEALRSGT